MWSKNLICLGYAFVNDILVVSIKKYLVQNYAIHILLYAHFETLKIVKNSFKINKDLFCHLNELIC